jgi:molecular chaperone DnaJ
VNHRIIIDPEAEAYALWCGVFRLHGTVLPAD